MYNLLTETELPKIIEVINYLGRDLMDWLEYLKEMVSLVGISGVVIVLWAVMPLLLIVLMITFITTNSKQSKRNNEAFKQNNEAMTKQIENLAIAINHLSDKVIDPPLNTEDSLEYFYLIMHEHISTKLSYLGDILRKNSINLRKGQIQKNIENEFKSITTKEANKLSKRKSVCGDMGKILQDNLNWTLFLGEVYAAFFVENTNEDKDFDHFKIQDIKTIMYGKVDLIAKIIEDNGVHN